MTAIISYILKFLIGGEKAGALSALVGYTADRKRFSSYRVVIIPSPFFREDVYGTDASMPTLPLAEVEGVPLLFGSPETAWYGDTLVVHADLVAGAYFLLTRYEEIRKRQIRDIHGRFPGKESLPYRAGFIDRPIVDEYGRLLRKWLREAQVPVKDPAPRIEKIWLTHDVDAPFYCRTFRSLIRESLRGAGFLPAWNMFRGKAADDPYYTFPWLLEQAGNLQKHLGTERCRTLFFFKSGGSSPYDKPRYRLSSHALQELLHTCRKEQASIGLHASYDAGKSPGKIGREKALLEKYGSPTVTCNRHHYLASREPEDMDWLEKAGITDDFTMGYPDVAGFRLGTARPVHWINPENRRISSLLLHPLTLMECSLNEPAYMHLNYEEALSYSLRLIEQVEKANGELILLWHNDSISTQVPPAVSVDWQRKLYTEILQNLAKR